MKNLKRILAALLVCMMTLAIVPVSAASTFSDVESGTPMAEAIEKLVSLGILTGYTDGTFLPDNTITRAEFCAVITRFLGQSEFVSQNTLSGFPDLDSDVNSEWARGYVKKAADLKIVNGFEDGTFRATEPVTYEQAVKMLVCALGYGTVAAAQSLPNDWSSGYITQAAELGVLKNAMVADKTQGASRGLVAILVYNALSVDKMVQDSNGNFYVDKGNNSLTQNLRKEEVEGIVTGIYRTGLTSGSSGLKANMVEIDGEKYLAGGIDVDALLGHSVSGYAQENEENDDYLELISLKEERGDNSIVRVEAEDIYSADAYGMEYFSANGKDGIATIAFDDADIIYNGKALPEYDMSNVANDVQSGYVEFLSNDGDKDADVIFIVDYETVVVSSATTSGGVTKVLPNSTYSTETITIPEADDDDYILSIHGSVSEARRIQKWDILTIMKSNPESRGKQVYDVTVTRNSKSGKISSVGTDDNGNLEIKLESGSTVYSFSESFNNLPEDKKPNLDLDQNVTLYLDSMGKVAAVTVAEKTASSTTAYLIGLEEEFSMNKSSVELWVYAATSASTGAEKFLTLADKVDIDGVNYDIEDVSAELLITAEESQNVDELLDNEEDYPYHQLIQYTTNSKGQVDSIDTLKSTNYEATNALKRGVAYSEGNELRYNSTAKTFSLDGSTKFVVGSSTRVISVPEDLSDIDKYSVRAYSSAFTNGSSYAVEAYNLSSTSVASYVVKYGAAAASIEFTYTTPYMIVNEIVEDWDADEQEAVDKIVGWDASGNEVSVVVGTLGGDSEYITDLDDIENGDVIRYMVSNNEVVRIKMAYKIGTVPELSSGGGENGSRFFATDSSDENAAANATRYVALYGTVLAYGEAEEIKITRTVASDEGGIDIEDFDTYNKLSNAKIFFYDSDAVGDNKVEVDASIDNILSYEDVEESDIPATEIFMISTSAGSWKVLYIVK